MMKKSLLVASVLAATTGVALAANNTSTYCKSGFYAGLQGGRGDTFYKPSQVLNQVASEDAGTNVSTENYYDNNGNLNETYATTTWGTTALYDQDVDDSGAAGRLYAGYQFNPYFAIEAGYTQFNKTSFSATAQNLQDSQSVNTNSGGPTYVSPVKQTTSTYSAEGDLTEHAVDVVAKATMPLQYGFGVYVKAGMAFIQANRYINVNDLGTSTTVEQNVDSAKSSTGIPNSSVTTNSNGINEQATLYDKTYQAFRPTYGAGIDYTIPNTKMDVEVFYSEIAGDKAIRTASLWGAGIAYKFA